MVGNPFSDTLIRIKNGYAARLKTVEIPYSKIKEEFSKILLKEGYLSKIEIKEIKSSSKKKAKKLKAINVSLKYSDRKPALQEVKIVSKSSLRVYVKKDKIPWVLGGRGLVILSTPLGLMAGYEARKEGLGGEIICKVW